MANNANLNRALKEKNDEFYTQYADIGKELVHYKEHFLEKVVYLPCDDVWSNFWEYFMNHFQEYGLRKLIASHYEKGAETVIIHSYDGENVSETQIDGDGDFRSAAVEPLWREADVIVTNPPFSLFREYIALLIKFNKKFVVMGNQNAVTYKEVFPLIKENKLWIGNGFNLSTVYKTPYPNLLEANRKFVISKGYNPDEGYVKVPAVCWFTNLDIQKRHEELILTNKYTSEKYLKYDNYNAINIDKTVDIPYDYYGIMGVPITFLDKFSTDRFVIIDILEHPYINGKRIFKRILIQRKEWP